MSGSLQDKIPVACPHCGHVQPEPREAFSTICKRCRRHFRVQDVLNPAPAPPKPNTKLRRLVCFDCGGEVDVTPTAQSSMCKRCGAYLDIRDYRITNAVSKNFKTQGKFVVEPTGYVFNCEAQVGEAIIRGRFLGKLATRGTMTIYSGAELKGTITAGHLVIPAGNHFRWKDPIIVGSAEILGELVASLRAEASIVLKQTSRIFGDIEARDLVVEAGAVLVGQMRVGAKNR